jgi:hypothetical protein
MSRLKKDSGSIQCVVSKKGLTPTLSQGEREEFVSFGNTQCPSLSDYADGVDTMEFLLRL